jgi:hypothetical protein
MKYLSENLIQESFLRLRETKPGGKKGLERTSALVVFLALDALLKKTAISTPVDLDPENSIGKNNRDLLTREVSKLVLIKNIGSEPCHVLNLGEITINSTTPEKRFSANFLTTPLKAATTDSKASGYPSRPKPILALGPTATKLTWGIDRHPSWKENLPVFLAERKTKTPFHDLACFVLRQKGFVSEATTLQEGLMDGLREVFTEELCSFWEMKLSLEKPYVTATANPFQEKLSTAFDDLAWAGCDGQSSESAALTDRISYLEGLLNIHHIAFEAK